MTDSEQFIIGVNHELTYDIRISDVKRIIFIQRIPELYSRLFMDILYKTEFLKLL